jgi:hypothetical protein
MYEEMVVDLHKQLGLLWTAYIESVLENAAADVFGVGRRKLAQMRSETAVDLNHYMTLYSSTDADGEIDCDIWDSTVETEFALRRKLNMIGVDIDAVNREIPIPDTFGQSWHSEAEWEQYKWRKQYIDSMEKKQNVYWSVALLWWSGEGYGAVRLLRYYRDIRRRYVEFAGIFLRHKDGWNDRMKKMVEAEQKRLISRGVEMEDITQGVEITIPESYGGNEITRNLYLISTTEFKK